jgi:hypothetical protein
VGFVGNSKTKAPPRLQGREEALSVTERGFLFGGKKRFKIFTNLKD